MSAEKNFRCVYILIICMISACGGGGGGDVAPSNQYNNTSTSSNNTSDNSASSSSSESVSQKVGGLWYGVNDEGDRVDLFIAETGELHFLTENDDQGVGTATVNGNQITTNFTLLANEGEKFFDGTTRADCSGSGSIQERQTFNADIICTTTLGFKTITNASFTYVKDVYERNSSLTTIAGNYDDGVNPTIIISEDGKVFWQDAYNCIINGNVYEIDTNYNAYRVILNVSNCNGYMSNNKRFTGFATLDNRASTEKLIVAVYNPDAYAIVKWMERTTNPKLGGIWEGKEDGKLKAFTSDRGDIFFLNTASWTGKIDATSLSVTGSVATDPRYRTADNKRHTDCVFNNSKLVEKTSFDFTLSCDTYDNNNTYGLSQFTYEFVFSDKYDEVSAIENLEGNWTSLGSTYSISRSGDVFWQGTAGGTEGCTINGQISLIDTRYNMYHLTESFSNCGDYNNITAVGIAFLYDNYLISGTKFPDTNHTFFRIGMMPKQ